MYKIINEKPVQITEQYKHPNISNYYMLTDAELIADGCIMGDIPVTELTDEQKAINAIQQASYECEQRIYEGFDSACLGETKHFDCQATDQATIQGLALTAILGLQGYTDEETHWKGTGELECYKFEYTEILQLATDLKKHIESNINQFNAERLAILNAD